jgi:hypothetical protein
MLDFSHKYTHTQKHKISHKHTLTADHIQLQQLVFSQSHKIEQKIDLELSQNPALEVEEEPDLLEDSAPEEHDDDWSQDYDKPADEYETGESLTLQKGKTWDAFDISTNLERAAIDHWSDQPERLRQALEDIDYYRISGCLPANSEPQLQDDLTALETSVSRQIQPSIHPTFEVTVHGDRVEAYVPNTGLNLRYRRGFDAYSDRAQKFIQQLEDRHRLLSDLAHHILEILQADFFRQRDLDTALRYLIPVPVSKVSKLGIASPLKIDKKSLSKLGDHSVSCRFGMLPLNYFLQEKAGLVRLWVRLARKEGIATRKEQLDWTKNQIERRVSEWNPGDVRHDFVDTLRKITMDDIKNADRMLR